MLKATKQALENEAKAVVQLEVQAKMINETLQSTKVGGREIWTMDDKRLAANIF
jgi:hypothetical protein